SSEEASMLVRVAEGDPTAVRDVLSRYSALVWSLASGLSNDPHDVEDVVQDIFVDVWRSAGRYDPAVASEATFIATIARRRVIDRRRRAGRRLDPEPLEEEFAPGESDDRLRQIDLHDEANQAREVVAQLTGDRRKVLELSVVDGLTHREIAADTGIPLGTVKSHIRRGLAEVTERLRARRSIQLGEDESPFMEGSL
ncbi:MAG: RNA polymerase sigma factor, partial [Planctomycetota bacterium]